MFKLGGEAQTNHGSYPASKNQAETKAVGEEKMSVQSKGGKAK